MQQRVHVLLICAAIVVVPQFVKSADQGAAGGLVGGSLSSNAPTSAESDDGAVQNLGAAAAGMGSAEDECVDALGAAATGGDATQDGDVSSAGDAIGGGLADASRLGCTSDGTSIGQAIGDGTQDATRAIVGE